MTLPAEKDPFLGQIVEEASEGLYRYASVLTRDRVEARDLVQETCVRAMEAIGSLRQNTNIRGWLFVCCKSLAMVAWIWSIRRPPKQTSRTHVHDLSSQVPEVSVPDLQARKTL